MDAQFWIGLGGLALLFLIQLAGGAFLTGGLFARVKRLESDLKDSNSIAQTVSALNATVTGFEKTMLGFERQLEHFSETIRDILSERSGSRRRSPPAEN